MNKLTLDYKNHILFDIGDSFYEDELENYAKALLSFLKDIQEDCNITSNYLKIVPHMVDLLNNISKMESIDSLGPIYEDAIFDLDIFIKQDIYTLLNDIAPEGFFFGEHPDDSNILGFWENPVEDKGNAPCSIKERNNTVRTITANVDKWWGDNPEGVKSGRTIKHTKKDKLAFDGYMQHVKTTIGENIKGLQRGLEAWKNILLDEMGISVKTDVILAFICESSKIESLPVRLEVTPFIEFRTVNYDKLLDYYTTPSNFSIIEAAFGSLMNTHFKDFTKAIVKLPGSIYSPDKKNHRDSSNPSYIASGNIWATYQIMIHRLRDIVRPYIKIKKVKDTRKDFTMEGVEFLDNPDFIVNFNFELSTPIKINDFFRAPSLELKNKKTTFPSMSKITKTTLPSKQMPATAIFSGFDLWKNGGDDLVKWNCEKYPDAESCSTIKEEDIENKPGVEKPLTSEQAQELESKEHRLDTGLNIAKYVKDMTNSEDITIEPGETKEMQEIGYLIFPPDTASKLIKNNTVKKDAELLGYSWYPYLLSLVGYNNNEKIDILFNNTTGKMKTMFENAKSWFEAMCEDASNVQIESTLNRDIVEHGLGKNDTEYLKNKKDKRKAKEDKKK